MKKFTTILMTVLMIVGLFVSCNNNTPVIDETVSVIFDESIERSLTASLETFNKNTYYWKYAADKADEVGLTSGETSSYDEAGALWIKGGDLAAPAGTGLGSVAGFSQGKWNFKLYAYKAETTGEEESAVTSYKLSYQGEITGVSLKKGSANTVSVTVSPVAGEKGTLKISSDIDFVPNKAGGATTGFTKVYTITALGSNASIPPTTGSDEWSLNAGAYKVNVDFVKDGYTYASGSVVATVYSNLTTTVSGTLNELVTEAVFDSSINPDIMNKVVSSDSVSYSDVKTEGSEAITLVTEDDSKVNATVPAVAAKKIIEDTIGSTSVTDSDNVKLFVSVDTTAATSTSLSLEISMSAVVSKIVDNGVEETAVPVSSLADYVTIEVDVQPGLNNVAVKHNGAEMQNLASLEESITNDNGAYHYNAEEGLLTIKTKSFSPFSISYDAPEYVAKVGDVNFTTLQKAIDAAPSKSTIILLKNVVLNKTVIIDKSITLNLNGYSIIGNKVRALQIKQGTTTITGTGTVSSDVDNVGSSVIRVGDNEAGSNAKLYIKEGVTVTTDTAYGITVFGNKNEYVYVYGSIISNAPENDSYDGCAISTLGDDFTKSNIYIYDGAVISAANTNAIYMPSGNLTVDEGSTISGRTGIYVKSGTTTIMRIPEK